MVLSAGTQGRGRQAPCTFVRPDTNIILDLPRKGTRSLEDIAHRHTAS